MQIIAPTRGGYATARGNIVVNLAMMVVVVTGPSLDSTGAKEVVFYYYNIVQYSYSCRSLGHVNEVCGGVE